MSETSSDYNLSRNYAKASLPILIVLMLYVGWWINHNIQKQVIDNTAFNAALYAQSFIAPELQGLSDRAYLSGEEIAHLEDLLSNTPLGKKIRSLKVWTLDGRLLYHQNVEMIGKRFTPSDSLLRAASGQVAAEFDEVAYEEEDSEEAKLGIELLEIYTPVKNQDKGDTIAVAEFYQEAKVLADQLRKTRSKAWLMVIITMLIAYGLLYGIVWRGSNIIRDQGQALREKISQLSELLQKNKSLSTQLRRAMNNNTEINEKLLTRISADLHDGPAQYIGFALLRLDSLKEAEADESLDVVEELHQALGDSLTELRNISKGLALPNLEVLTILDIVSSAIKAHEHRTNTEVDLKINLGGPEINPMMPIKIALFRCIQEGLTNAYRHAAGIGQKVSVGKDEEFLIVTITDKGAGFSIDKVSGNSEGLGLNGLRERIKGLGGEFSVTSQINIGTTLVIKLPLLENT